ncbi:MAG: hypothetical protein IJ542_00090 [Clostridia bacterium]|nr:hypothetical protein [Clostridia bacterium]
MKKIRLASAGALIFDFVALTILIGVLVMFCVMPNTFPFYGIIGAAILIALCIVSLVLRFYFKLKFNYEDKSLSIVQFSVQKINLLEIQNVAFYQATNNFAKASIEIVLLNGNIVNVNITGFGKKDTTKRAEQLAQLIADFSAYVKSQDQEEK